MFIPEQTLGSVTDYRSGATWAASRINEAAARSTDLLRRLDVGPGDRVAVYHGGSGAFFADLLAIWQVGACAACLNPGLTRAELETISTFTEPRLILVDQDAEAAAVGEVPMICSRSNDVDAAPAAGGNGGGGSMDDAALILFTSGTTGTPKGVVHSFRSLLSRLNLNRQFIGDATLRRTICALPTHFGHGLIGNCLTPLLFGHDLLLVPGNDMATLAKMGDIVDRHEISFMSSVPAFWKMVGRLSEPPQDQSLLRVHVGSAPLSADLWRQIVEWSGTDDVVNMYGITETANWIAGASARDLPPEDGLIGRMWGGEAAVRAADGSVRAEGEGELMVQSPSLMTGYYRLDDKTREVLVDGWFRTGDVGRIDGDGVMRLTGRQKSEINRAGLKIHPEDIDLLLERHELIREACAFGFADPISGEAVGVAISLVDGSEIGVPEIRAWCAERLAREKRPDKWFIVADIPKTDRGKINRERVADHCLAPE